MSSISVETHEPCNVKPIISTKCKISIFCTTISLVIFLISFIQLPSKPEFSLKEAHINQLILSPPNLLNSSIQIHLISTNPNQNVGIYFDQFQVYAEYRQQQITDETSVPPFYQEHEETTYVTASLMGSTLSVPESFLSQIRFDQSAGILSLYFKVNGNLKFGTWVLGRHRLNVNCVAVMAFGPIIPTGPLSLKEGSQCSTSI